MMDLSDGEYGLFRNYLENACGIAVPPEKRYLFITRLSDLLKELLCTSFSEFYSRLTHSAEIQKTLIECMTTNETSFFRDSNAYQVLREIILPELAKTTGGGNRRKIYIGSIGCSTGQEPYSLAMTVMDWIKRQSALSSADFTIFGLDISSRVLAKAQMGVYTENEMARGVDDYHRLQYFHRRKEEWGVNDEIRKMVTFGECNLKQKLCFPGRFDLILCRNVIIYFSMPLKTQIVESFRELLNPGGILMLGSSETLYQISSAFEPLNHGQILYYKKPV